MFPDQIEPLALIAIRCSEVNCLNYLLEQLCGWMDSPDPSTAAVACKIGVAMRRKFGETEYTDVTNKLLNYSKIVLNDLTKQ
jgi:hypothetical protein